MLQALSGAVPPVLRTRCYGPGTAGAADPVLLVLLALSCAMPPLLWALRSPALAGGIRTLDDNKQAPFSECSAGSEPASRMNNQMNDQMNSQW